VTTEELQERVNVLEGRIESLETEYRQRSLDSAYMYIHSNWNLIRWYLARERDVFGQESDTYGRSISAEEEIRIKLPPNLRFVQFADSPMDVAYNWRIETTVILNQHGFTFFD